MGGDQFRQAAAARDRADTFFQPLRSQHFAHGAVRFHDLEVHVRRRQLFVKPPQHPRAGHIDVRNI